MAQDCRYLLDTLLYNPDLYPGNNRAFSDNPGYFGMVIIDESCTSGPPFFVPDEQVHSLFGECS